MRRILVAIFALAACGETPYQPMLGGMYGYHDRKDGDDRYMIVVRVNGSTSQATAHQYGYRRAKEVCTDESNPLGDFDIVHEKDGADGVDDFSFKVEVTCKSGVSVPALKRREVIEEELPVAGIVASATPVGTTGWRVVVRNDSDENIQLIWDESSFVTPDGESGGRLVRGETRKIDTDKAQPPSPIAPHSTLREIVLIDKFIELEELEKDASKHREHVTKKLHDQIIEGRKEVSRLIVGGHMYLVFATDDGKHTWKGVVRRAVNPAEPAGQKPGE